MNPMETIFLIGIALICIALIIAGLRDWWRQR